MFDDEKIKIIESLPDGDTIIVIWVRLLCIAGRINDDGCIYVNQKISYNYETLSTVFNKSITIIRLALETFIDFSMIEICENGVISICNWDKHQNIEGLQKIREQTKSRVRKHREQKALKDGNVTVTLRNAIEEDKEENKNKKYIVNQSLKNFVDWYNKSFDRKFKALKKHEPKYKSILKEFTKEELATACKNAHNDLYHKETNYKYLTIEFFLRSDKVDKFLNKTEEKSEVSTRPNQGAYKKLN